MKSIASITTRQGDGGTTRLFSGEEVGKAHPRLEALGDLDELNSQLGLARSLAERAEVREALLPIQKRLFAASSEVATQPGGVKALADRIAPADVADLDGLCSGWEARIEHPKGFIIPGEKPGGAQLDVARAVARRCERRLAALSEQGELENAHLLAWMNRLSDALWLLARLEEGTSRPLREPAT